jgi:hypothetical protein
MTFQSARRTRTVMHGAGVTGVRYGTRAANRATSEPPAMVPVRTAVPVRAVVRKRIVSPFGSPACRPTVPPGRAVRTIRQFRSPAAGVPPGAELGS